MYKDILGKDIVPGVFVVKHGLHDTLKLYRVVSVTEKSIKCLYIRRTYSATQKDWLYQQAHSYVRKGNNLAIVDVPVEIALLYVNKDSFSPAEQALIQKIPGI